MRILHLTVHMGGGIGRAIHNLTQKDGVHTHTVICLQMPEKDAFIRACRECGVQVICEPAPIELLELLRMSDVCIIHWWGHPAMARMLAEFPPIPVRCILWCHVNGLYYPWISPSLLAPCHAVFFTSPCSFEAFEWTAEQKADILDKKAQVIYGIGDMSKFTAHERHRRDGPGIRIGYVGSFVQSKINPRFVEICNEILQQHPNAQFILAGDPREYQWILRKIRNLGIADSFQAVGYVKDVPALLDSLDIFLYPLNPTHFATTENSILEAMAMKLPVVLMNQSTERTIITHLKDGILADGEEDIVKWVHRLAIDPDLREQLGNCARDTVLKHRDADRNIINFHSVVAKITGTEKRVLVWPEYVGHSPWEWFLNAVRPDMRPYFKETSQELENVKLFLRAMPIFTEPSKGSILHFYKTFPDDPILLKWKHIIAGILDDGEKLYGT